MVLLLKFKGCDYNKNIKISPSSIFNRKIYTRRFSSRKFEGIFRGNRQFKAPNKDKAIICKNLMKLRIKLETDYRHHNSEKNQLFWHNVWGFQSEIDHIPLAETEENFLHSNELHSESKKIFPWNCES